ncbi:MAG: hypothetical protein ACOZAO_03430 [Patescibacteria group bacterium]
MGLIRLFIRSVVFSYIALFATQVVINAFVFEESTFISIYFLIILALGLLNLFIRPILSLIGLPSRGVFYLFMTFVITLITIYALTVFLPNFGVQGSVMQELRFFGFVLPSKELSPNWAIICSALSFSVIYNFFEWLCWCKN